MEKKAEKQVWNSKLGFILAAIGSAVGLGNIWRFPYQLYENGGGAFLIPYFIAIFTAAIPLLIFEYTMGHKYKGAAPLAFVRANKKLEWLGWLATFVAGVIITYYSVIIAWSFNYSVFSFTQGWGENPEAFFFNDFLKISSGATDISGFNFKSLIGLVLIWGGSYVVCSKSIGAGIEKLNKFLLPLMFLIVFIFVIKSVSLEGSEVGLNALFTPDWSLVREPKVWVAAYGQVFFSLSVAMGIMITFSSYLPEKTDIVNTAFITGLANSAFEFTVAIGVFSILGYMAQNQGVPIDQVVSAGVGLAFVVFPQGFNLMGDAGVIIGVLFFVSLSFAGFTSFVSLIEAFSRPISEKFGLTRKQTYKYLTVGGFLLSVVYATGAGLYILDMVDFAVNSFVIIPIGILEAVVAGYVINTYALRTHANKYSYIKLNKSWDFALKVLVPLVLGGNLVLAVKDFLTNGYGGYSTLHLAVFCGGTIVICVVGSVVMPRFKYPVGVVEEVNVSDE